MAQFKTWLRSQQIRPDTVGRFAQAAMSDPEFPDANNPTLHSNYLASKGANKKLLLTLQQAYKEFGEFQVRERDGQPATRKVTKPQTPRKEPAKAKSVATTAKVSRAETKPKAERKVVTPAPVIAEKLKAAVAPKPRVKAPKKEVLAQNPVPAIQPLPEKNETAKTVSRESGNEKRISDPKPVPTKLGKHKNLLAEAVQLLDTQFGKGFSAQHPETVINYIKTLAHEEQANRIRNLLARLGETLLDLSKK